MIHAALSNPAERAIAMAHLSTAAHAAVIGYRILPHILALMDCGCPSVRSLRPDAAAPDCEAADLAWIVNVDSDGELHDALRVARRLVGDKGRIVLEVAVSRKCRSLLRYVANAGLGVVSFDHRSQRIVLANRSRLAVAA
ncbi:MAG: hypothetical protein JSR91_06235 [Proteobacteria bacterium]|nr:hypothetical protein [Pseudomonadota bacterium]